MTVSQIIAAACRPLGLDYSDIVADAVELEQFLGYINTAQRTIERRGDWRWLYVSVDRETTAERDYVEIGADFAAWQSDNRPYFIAGGFERPRYASPGDFEHLRTGAPSSGGWPVWYTETYDLDSRQYRMLVYPTPGDAYGLRIPYRRFLTDLTGLEDEPLLPEVMHQTLKLGAMAEAEEQREKMPRGAQRDKFQLALESDWQLFKTPDRGEQRIAMRRAGGDRELDNFDAEINHAYSVRVDP